ncbi:hypothetical protein JOB18_027599 [Solea senegalensis]|uniref:Uncharacterized protein n=1 Tax=Solea senegalensis TaxID=28829 RepID=A0AAV6QUU2_SOLSE|nr:hypothetical protein JOB18_027599 [Solea senegalensis]
MGKVHICLKRSFIGVINVIAILNAIMFGDLIANGHLPDGEEIQNKPQLLVFTITPLVLVILGVFGVYKKKKWALIVFQCCGLARGYMDWGHDIPDTCECIGSATSNPCVELYTSDDSVRMVYEKPCLPYLMENYEWFITVVGGIAMAFSLLWMLSVVLSIVILCILNQEHKMAKVHICLKRSFIAVASVIMIVNVLLLVCVLIVHGLFVNSPELASQLKDIHYVYVFLIIPLVLVVFGLVGVCKKKKWAVIVFTAGMILMSLILFLVSIVALGSKSELTNSERITRILVHCLKPVRSFKKNFQNNRHNFSAAD